MKKSKKIFLLMICMYGSVIAPATFAYTTDTSSVVRVSKALYESTPPRGFTYCDATAYVGSTCNGKASCQVYADDTICGDPDPGYFKHLVTSYRCGNAAYVNDTPEYGIATLSCDDPAALPNTKRVH